MKRAILIAVLLGMMLAGHVAAFAFTDYSALAQRASQLTSHMTKWTTNINKFTEQINVLKGYVSKFQEYYGTFNQYKAKVESVYRKIRGRDWQVLMSTVTELYAKYFREKQPELMQYAEMDNYQEVLTTNEFYKTNPKYKEYVDILIDREKKYRENMAKIMDQVHSIQGVQQTRLDKLNDYERTNKEMSYEGNEDASVTEQMALLNQIMIEQARSQHETQTLIRMMYETTMNDKYEEFERLGLHRKYSESAADERKMIQDMTGAEVTQNTTPSNKARR